MVQEVLNRKQVALILGCSPGTVDNLVKRGELGYTQRWLGGHRCFTWEIVNDYKRRLNERKKLNDPKRRQAA